MIKTPWINSKEWNVKQISSELQQSFNLNQLTNYGPVVRKLENYFTKELELSSDKSVIVVVNAAIGLSMLVSGINMYYDKNLKYATQSYTFPCAVQGPLQESQIVDIDDDLSLNLSQVNLDNDGIIVTNLFGTVCDIDKYTKWCEDNNKFLIFDNATVPFTKYKDINAVNYGIGCIISLHHTKPIGFGEGGLIIIDKKYEESVRKCLNFGFEVIDGKVSWNKHGSNGKMSEISAAAILTFLQSNKDKIYDHQIKMYQLFEEKIKSLKGVKLFPTYSSGTPFVSCLALLFEREISNNQIYELELSNITARKYYTPLDNSIVSNQTFNCILCLPCHLDMNENTLDLYVKIIHKLSK
jgi:dTDP-4-amino-4,6-dideoxygalactose transaminase